MEINVFKENFTPKSKSPIKNIAQVKIVISSLVSKGKNIERIKAKPDTPPVTISKGKRNIAVPKAKHAFPKTIKTQCHKLVIIVFLVNVLL